MFGIRSIVRQDNLSYWVNGKRLFLKGAWYPIVDIFGSKPTRETYETDLMLYRAANLNHLVNFTVVEKPEFYELCDRLGILNFFEFPFTQSDPRQCFSAIIPGGKSTSKIAFTGSPDSHSAAQSSIDCALGPSCRGSDEW